MDTTPLRRPTRAAHLGVASADAWFLPIVSDAPGSDRSGYRQRAFDRTRERRRGAVAGGSYARARMDGGADGRAPSIAGTARAAHGQAEEYAR